MVPVLTALTHYHPLMVTALTGGIRTRHRWYPYSQPVARPFNLGRYDFAHYRSIFAQNI